MRTGKNNNVLGVEFNCFSVHRGITLWIRHLGIQVAQNAGKPTDKNSVLKIASNWNKETHRANEVIKLLKSARVSTWANALRHCDRKCDGKISWERQDMVSPVIQWNKSKHVIVKWSKLLFDNAWLVPTTNPMTLYPILWAWFHIWMISSPLRWSYRDIYLLFRQHGPPKTDWYHWHRGLFFFFELELKWGSRTHTWGHHEEIRKPGFANMASLSYPAIFVGIANPSNKLLSDSPSVMTVSRSVGWWIKINYIREYQFTEYSSLFCI